jgi:K+-sensing histidine kinase KdpD
MKAQAIQSEGEWGQLAVPSVLAAAHELKTPLALIRQLSYQLESAGGMSAEQKIVQERIRLTSERALRLVDNITKVARLEDAMFALEPLQAHAVWSDVVQEMTPLAQGLGQVLDLRAPKRPLLVVAHRELLPAILLGLCDNALSHNPTGSAVQLSVKESKGTMQFSVRDKGPRLDRAVFNDFARRLGSGPQPLGARPNSSGLGLWIAGSFAEAMNSSLSVVRHRRGGMTFSLHVPISTQIALL